MAEIKDSGNRREFASGAVRDISEGKGRCDLLPLYEVGMLLDDEILKDIGAFVKYPINLGYLYDAVRTFAMNEFNGIVDAMLELSVHFEDGCRKYGARNWEKGLDVHCFIDSGVRHYLKHLRGDKDERHDRAFMWNMMCCIWTVKNKPELNDLNDKESEQG